VVISDVRTPERREAESGLEKILAITGGDPVTINRKHKEQLSLSKLVCRFTLAGNEIPNLTDHSRALEARTSLIHLPNSYVGREDRGLKARLCEEARRGAIVPWALEGLKRLRKNGRFTMPESSSDLQSQFRRSISPLTEFIEEYCYLIDVDELERETPQKMRRKAFESKDIVYQAYTTWCENRGLYPMWREKFCAAIQRELPQVGSVRIMENGKRLYAFVGLRLNRWAFSELLNLPNGAGDLPDESDNDE
jgi:putative DNA primase/helicase